MKKDNRLHGRDYLLLTVPTAVYMSLLFVIGPDFLRDLAIYVGIGGIILILSLGGLIGLSVVRIFNIRGSKIFLSIVIPPSSAVIAWALLTPAEMLASRYSADCLVSYEEHIQIGMNPDCLVRVLGRGSTRVFSFQSAWVRPPSATRPDVTIREDSESMPLSPDREGSIRSRLTEYLATGDLGAEQVTRVADRIMFLLNSARDAKTTDELILLTGKKNEFYFNVRPETEDVWHIGACLWGGFFLCSTILIIIILRLNRRIDRELVTRTAGKESSTLS